VVVNSKKELIYISRSLIPGSKKTIQNKNYFKQVCIYAFNKNELKKFYSVKKKSEIEKMGGKVSNTISSKTTALIIKDTTATSGKIDKAKQLNSYDRPF
jgi:CMP-2-keto-3-deoxyoctulosonic acid synthetase